MVALPGGTFRMGSEKDVLLRQFPAAGEGLKSMLLAEIPAHQVTIRPFLMDRCEVTNADFQRFVRSRPEWNKGRVGGEYLRHWQGDRFRGGLANLPVAFVSWQAAVAYAEWAGKRLPTEGEWEFAARGGLVNPKYPWGNEEPTPSRANFRLSGFHRPVSVGSYPPNQYGLFDLAGNVWEFCLDEWAPYRAGPQRQSEDDLRRMRVATAERRVIRGGSFDGGAFNVRVTARDSHQVDNPVAHVGFRCARSR
jgi:formylglycine-generating enzyme required for sulfatase activity